MKTQIKFFTFLLVLAVFASCTKDQLTDLTATETEEVFDQNALNTDLDSTQLTEPVALDAAALNQADAIQIEEVTSNSEVASRSQLVFSTTATVSAGNWKHYYYAQTQLTPGRRYTAYITPNSGEPDLYIHGYDAERSSVWRRVRYSNTAGDDVSFMRLGDFQANEERAYFSIYGRTTSSFKLYIYVDNTDCGEEDCLPFNPNNLTIVFNGSGYTVADGSHWIFAAPTYAEAQRIAQVVKHYQLNQTCYVGRPDPSFTYLTRNGNSPEGALAGEDCIAFDPNDISVKYVNGRWKIVEGTSHWMFDFGSSYTEASQAYCRILKYGFRYSCFVGRPDPSLQYMRR